MAKKSDGRQVSVILPKATHRWVAAAAKMEGITLAAFIRRLVFQKQREEKAPKQRAA